MIYLDPTPNPSGAYPNPKLQPFPGGIPLEGEGEKLFFQYNGFVTLGEDGSVTPNTQAWEEWTSSQPPETEPEPEPTTDELLNILLGVTADG